MRPVRAASDRDLFVDDACVHPIYNVTEASSIAQRPQEYIGYKLTLSVEMYTQIELSLKM